MKKQSIQLGRQAPRLSRRRAIAMGAGASGTALLLACGQKSTGGAKSNAAPAGQTEKPVSGGTLRVPLADDFFTFDPSIDAKIVNPYGQTLGYESLLTFKAGPGVDFYDTTLAPVLAVSWETPDAQTYVFHLRKNVKFANIPPVNGRGFNAADVKWSLEYQSRTGAFGNAKVPPGDLTYMFEGMDGVTTPDDSTAVVHFGAPFAPFLNYASGVGTLIMPHELMDVQGGFQTNIVGTGPFQLDNAATQHGSHWVFKKNPGYWDTGRPYLDAVNHLILKDSVSTLGAFQARQIDIIRVTDLQVVGTMKKSNPDAVAQDVVNQQLGLYINNARPPLGDERVRRAVTMAIDRKEFDQTFAAGKSGFAMLGTLPGTFTQQEMAQILTHDPGGAKSLLTAAGFPNGVQLEVMMSSPDTAPQAQLLQGQLKQAGINTTIRTLDGASWAQRLHKSDFDLSLNAFAVVGDVDSKLYGNFDGKSPGNYVGAKDPAYDKLAEAQRQEIDPAKRREAVRAASRYIQEHGMSTALYLQGGATFWQPSLKNYADHWEQFDWRSTQVWTTK
jgi:peptide/nickel transport system substrate-binding protein